MIMAFLETDLAIFDEKFTVRNLEAKRIGGSPFFWASKRIFDIVVSLCLLPLLAVAWIVLLVINPLFNSGPIFFSQVRMGRDCTAFGLLKFRSMTLTNQKARGPDDPLETDRITKLGAFMRKTRIDELPQVLNVLKGDMSLIGPRPDSFSHARTYVRVIPEYRHRHQVRPGISGLAQVSLGYAEGITATRKKAQADTIYIKSAGFRLETMLVGRTILTVLSKAGS